MPVEGEPVVIFK